MVAQVDAYVAEVVEAVDAVVPVAGAYVLGSALLGGFDPARSDLDVVVVVERPLDADERAGVWRALDALPPPARKLELVFYARGAERHELNVNTGELVHFDPDDDPGFWFVIDRAIAEQHSIALLGPPWEEEFPPVSHEAVVEALDAAATFEGWDDPRGAELAAARARIWRETGEWVSKAEARRRA